jgi:hypothetical protein
MGILLNQMKLGGLNCGRRVVEFASGISITCTVNYRDRHFDIIVPENLGGENIKEEYVVGFLCRPRTDQTYDQVQDNFEERKENQVVYWGSTKWLHKNYVVTIKTTDLFGNLIAVTEESNEYGNIDWKGPRQDDSKDPTQHYRQILTWKGPPSRYFPLAAEINYPGVTVLDTWVEQIYDDIIRYTPFSPNIYQHGRVLAVGPPVNYPVSDMAFDTHGQILGTALQADGTLVAVVKATYGSREKWWTVDVSLVGKVYPMSYHDTKTEADAAKTIYENDVQYTSIGCTFKTVEHLRPGLGYWYEVYTAKGRPNGNFYTYLSQGGWKFVGRVAAAVRPKVPWFFNASGTEASTVEVGTVWKVVLVTNSVTKEVTATFTGTAAADATLHMDSTSTQTQTDAYGAFAATIPMVSGGGGEGPVSPFRWGVKMVAAMGIDISPAIGLRGVENTRNTAISSSASGTCVVAVDYNGDNLVRATTVVSMTGADTFYTKRCPKIYGGNVRFWSPYSPGSAINDLIRATSNESTWNIGHVKDRDISFQIQGVEKFKSSTTKRDYSYNFHRYFKFGSAVTDDLTGPYLQEEGVSTLNITGSIAESCTALISQIVALDLRNEILVWRETSRTRTFSGEGDAPAGTLLVDTGYGLMTGYFQDVVLVNAPKTLDTVFKQELKISTPAYTKTLHTKMEAVTTPWKVGITDFSGARSMDYLSYHWDQVGIVDTDYPYTGGTNPDYHPLVDSPVEAGWPQEDYLPEWLDVLHHHLDSVDNTTIDGLFYTSGSRTVAYDIYPSVDPVAQGSWATDGAGDIFISMNTDNGTTIKDVFNLLKRNDGVEDSLPDLFELVGNKPTYYPVAPV